MKLKILILAFPLSLAACASIFPKNGVVETQFENGSFQSSYTYINNKIDGKCKVASTDNPRNTEITEGTCKGPDLKDFSGVKTRYQLGQIISTSEYTNGINTGTTKDFYQDGKIKAIYHVDHGKKFGAYESYDERGNLTSKGQYSEGKFTGKHYQWHDNNQKAHEVTLSKDVITGLELHWFDTGIKASEINHDSNKAETYAKKLKLESIQNQTVIRKWDANGNLIQDGVINIVGFSGFYYSYFPSGNLNTKRKVISLLETPEYLWSATAYFDNAKGNTKSETIADTTMDGLLHFKSTTNFYTEQHKLEAVLRQHIPDDSNETIQHLTTYYENGSKEQESTAIEGKVFGTAKTWWPNGKIKTIESYKKSKLIGPYKEWNKHGNLMQSGIYTIEGGESKFTGKSTFYNEDNNRVQLQKLKGMTHGLVKITDSKSHPVSTLLVANDKILLKTDTTKIERKNKLHQHMFGFGFFADDSTFSINDSNINNVSLSSFRVTLSNGNKQKNYIEFENLNNDICNTKDQLPNSVKIDNQNIKVLSWCDHNSYSRTHTQLRITPSTAAGTKFLLNHLKKHSTITVTYNGITSELDIRGFNKVWNTAGGDAL